MRGPLGVSGGGRGQPDGRLKGEAAKPIRACSQSSENRPTQPLRLLPRHVRPRRLKGALAGCHPDRPKGGPGCRGPASGLRHDQAFHPREGHLARRLRPEPLAVELLRRPLRMPGLQSHRCDSHEADGPEEAEGGPPQVREQVADDLHVVARVRPRDSEK